MYKPVLFLLLCILVSSCQPVVNSLVPPHQSNDDLTIPADDSINVQALFESEEPLRCAPAEKDYTHMGALNSHSLILANDKNDVVIATLRNACPRLLEEDRIMMLFRNGLQRARKSDRMCMDDRFMMLNKKDTGINPGDRLRTCTFRAFYVLPAPQVLEVVKSNKIMFNKFGIL